MKPPRVSGQAGAGDTEKAARYKSQSYCRIWRVLHVRQKILPKTRVGNISCVLPKVLGKIFLRIFENCTSTGEGLVTSSSDTLRKCSYDSPQFVMCPMLARDFEGAQKHAYVVCNNRDEM